MPRITFYLPMRLVDKYERLKETENISKIFQDVIGKIKPEPDIWIDKHLICYFDGKKSHTYDKETFLQKLRS